jgi:acyl-coenzyme A thioesterase PaaI-like protein
LLDNACGVAIGSKLRAMGIIATLDLRIDYLRPGEPGKALYARAECFKVTRSVAFVRGIAYEDDVDDPVATCAAAFMITNPKAPAA